MIHIPDNYDRFISYEEEQERLKRIELRIEYEEDLDTYDEYSFESNNNS